MAFTNCWKNCDNRINDFENTMGKNNPMRIFLVRKYITEYHLFVTERLEQRGDDEFTKRLNIIKDIDFCDNIDMTNFIHNEIFDKMTLAELCKFGEGKRIKDMVEDIICNEYMKILCAENEMINTYISAEPTLSDDEYWDEYNWCWNTLYSVLGYQDPYDNYCFNEFEMLHHYLYNKDKIIKEIKKAFGELYFPTTNTFVIQRNIKVNAKSKEEAELLIDTWLNERIIQLHTK